MTEAQVSPNQKSQIRAETPQWYYSLQPDPQTAVDFVNAPPPQGAGQAVFSVREDGRTDTFIYL